MKKFFCLAFVFTALISLIGCDKDNPEGFVAPSICIMEPTSGDSYVTTDNSINLKGVLSNPLAVRDFSYSINGGHATKIKIGETWSTGDIQLISGDNNIVFTAKDWRGEISTASFLVICNEDLVFINKPQIDQTCFFIDNAADTWITTSILFNPDVTITNISFVEVDNSNAIISEICQLYDDGDLNSHGDEIKYDNIFSCIHTFDFSTKGEKRFRIKAEAEHGGKSSTNFSPIVALPVYDEAEAVQIVEELKDNHYAIASQLDLMRGSGLQGKSLQKDFTEFLKSSPEVDSFTNDDGLFRVNYSTGHFSFFFIGDNNSKGGHLFEDRERETRTSSIPVERQTRGDFGPTLETKASSATAGDNTLIQNKNVLIWTPGFFNVQMKDSLDEIFASSELGFNVTHVDNSDCTVKSLFDLSKYGIVVIDTHGSEGDWIMTGEEDGIWSELSYFAGVLNSTVSVAEKNGVSYLMVSADYLDKQMKSSMPNSIVFNGSCESTKTDKLSNMFIRHGAKTYLGFLENVGVSFCIDKADEFFTLLTHDLKNSGDSFIEDGIYQMKGSKEMHFSPSFINGDFEFGNLNGWTIDGDGRIITRLSAVTPTNGHYMGIISTGLGYTTDYGNISQGFKLGKQSILSFKWNFLSEEFMEYVGSQYQDYLEVTISDLDSGKTEAVFHKTIDNFADRFSLIPVSPDIVFDQGGVYATGWQQSAIDISKYQGKNIEISISTGDIGDSLYDSAVLLDEIEIQ